ncbi:MAG: carboxypeptidase-like regulatory domain-containing protein [Candidatus Caldatribacteriaceae bacterium]
MKRFLIWVSVIFLLAGCGVRWQVKDTWVYVFENSPQGITIPLQGALVSVAGEGYTGAKYTDDEGKVLFQVPPGTYVIQVSKNGYASVTDTITIYTLELTAGRYYYVLIPQGR